MRPALPSRTAQHGGFFLGLVFGVLIGLATALGVALYVTKVPVPFINKVPQRTPEQDAAEAEKNKHWNPNAPLVGKNPQAHPSDAPVVPPTLPGPAALPAPATAPPAATGARDPGAILAGAESTADEPDALVYFVQAGAYSRTEEAEAQRAKLAIQGFESRISEREQAGRTMYRVRVGPFSQRADAEHVKETLATAGMETALVRVQQ